MLRNDDWDFILNTLNEDQGGCVLLIGREICVTSENRSLEEAMLEHLNIGEDENILKYYGDDGLFLFRDGMSKTKSYYKIRDFYLSGLNQNLYKKIAKIPFHLIISTSPDHTLENIFKEEHTLHQFGVYNKTENPIDFEQKPHKDFPLLYNLLGSIHDEESLVLTHDDVFEYMQGVFGTRPIPNTILETLLKSKNLIFLGFKFEKWYVQLLMRLLGIHEKDRARFARYAFNKSIFPATKSLVMEQFRIAFIDNNIEAFITELYNRCENSGLLRQEAAQGSVFERVRNYVEADELDNAIRVLKNYAESSNLEDFNDDIILLSNSYSRLSKRISRNIIDDRDAGVETAKIVERILNILGEIEDHVQHADGI